MTSATESTPQSDITHCSICMKTWKDPRSLPACDHTFCLQCLNTFVQKLNEDGEDTRCLVCHKPFTIPDGSLDLLPKSPGCELCRFNISAVYCVECKQNICATCEIIHSHAHGFAIPDGGLDMLPKNFMHQKLIDAHRDVGAKVASIDYDHHEEIPGCELCRFNFGAEYCVECEQNICATCKMIHLRSHGTMHHKVVELGDNNKNQLIMKLHSNYCQEHQEQKKLYCNECHKLVCSICCATEQKCVGHKFSAIKDAAQGFKEKIKEYQVIVEDRIAKTERYLGQIKENRNIFLEIVSDKVKKLQEKEEEMISHIKAEHLQLWNELKQIKEKRLEMINMKEDEVRTELATLKSFMSTSKELIDSGSAIDICQSSDDLLVQADVLEKSRTQSKITCSLDQIDISFIPAMKPDVNGSDVRLVGIVSK